LPDSAPVVYDSDSLIVQSHNIFIDTVSGNLYSCGGATNLGLNKLSVYSLSADPINPQFLINCENDVPFWSATIGYIHDIYVRNDTAYCNAGLNGLFIVDFTNMLNVQGLGSMTSYPQQGYNHSGWLNSSGNYYAFADETHGMDVKIVDVTNFSNINLINTFSSDINDSLSIPHNLIFNGNNLFVSYYFDGLYVFNTSDPNNISIAGYYDTSTRPHQNNVYQGCWGVYPFLPSGKILVSDMQEGLFVFNTTFTSNINENSGNSKLEFLVYPNPASNQITVTTTLFSNPLTYFIYDVNGKVVKEGKLTKSQTNLNLVSFNSGFYSISITQNNGIGLVKKFVKN